MNAIETSSDILKNAILDSTEAYLEARLAVADFVKTQIGVVSTCTLNESDKRYYHTVKCDNNRVTYNNVLSIGNTAFPEDSVVFLIAPNAQFSNQFILGKLDSTPINIEGGSINIGGGDFIVDSNGNLSIGGDNFKVSSSGELDIGDGNFIVTPSGDMTATSGRIGGFTLDNNYLFALGVVYLRTNDLVVTPSKEAYHKELSIFKPSDLGILSNFTITFNYNTVRSASRSMTIWLQYYNELQGWQTIQQETLENSSEEKTLTFNTTFSNNDTRDYRIYLIINGTSSNTYTQSVRYSIYTDEVVKTALTTDGYNGKINSSSGIIGGIDLSTGKISSLNDNYSSGFEIDGDSIEIRSGDNYGELLSLNQTYFMYSKSYAWTYGRDFSVRGLFVATDSSVNHTTLTLYKDSNNYLELESDGSYYYFTNGTGHGGYLSGSSDERIKEDIKPLDIEMSKELISKTNTYKFKYKNNDGYHYGVIAQEARKLLNDLKEEDSKLEYGVGDTNIKDQRTINYQEYIPPLINVIQDLQRRVDKLEKEDK